MAQTSTLYTFDISLSNVDRGVYQSLCLQLARHPSETIGYMVTRLFARCLEHCEGISFSKGLADADEPAVWAHDLTGALTLWIEVGAPSAEKLHRASKLGIPVVVYTHKDPDWLLGELRRREIFNAAEIRIYAIPSSFIDAVSIFVERRTQLALSLSEGQLYVDIGGQNLSTELIALSLSI